jgi:hypothetical protein
LPFEPVPIIDIPGYGEKSIFFLSFSSARFLGEVKVLMRKQKKAHKKIK